MTVAAFIRATKLAAFGVVALVLGACSITSLTNLVTPEEAATPLPATFAAYDYYEEDGAYHRNEDPYATFTLADNVYATEDGTLSVAFVALDEPDLYLVAATLEGATSYGLGRLRDGLLELRLLLVTAEDSNVAAGITLPEGATVDGSSIMVDNRAALDALIGMIRDGTIPVTPSPFWVGDGDGPAQLTPKDGWYTLE